MRRPKKISSAFIGGLLYRYAETLAKNRSSNADNGGSFTNSDTIIIGHAHREMLPGTLRQFVPQTIAQGTQLAKDGSHCFWIIYQWCDSHQPLYLNVWQSQDLTSQ